MSLELYNGHTTNFQKWRYYNDGLISPESFINFGWFHLVGACLQRRVWVGPKHMQLFGNQYTTLVADPGIGKGLVIRQVSKFLRHHKMKDPHEKETVITGNKLGQIAETVNRELLEEAAKANFNTGMTEEQRGPMSGKIHHITERPLLFPVAADSTTFEALVMSMARALRLKEYSEFDPGLQRNVKKLYTHSSLSFCLEEISSLFRKKAEDVANFLQITYDCGDYKKDTKHQGTDQIRKCCLNFFGGTQPNFMRRSFSDGLLNEGFASRSWFIFETRNRKVQLFIPPLNDVQLQYEADILDHLKKLSELYGGCTYTPEAEVFMVDWWNRAQLQRSNLSDKLLHYYSRKNIHVQKLAMAIHFSENLDLTITLDDCKTAIAMLGAIERKMHHAIITKSENQYYNIGLKIMSYLDGEGPRTKKELFARFYEDLPTADPHEALGKIIDYNITMGKMNSLMEGGVTRYSVIRKEIADAETYET